jgi:hypothetical protein
MKFNIYFFFGLYVILYPACQPALKVQKQPADLLEQLMSKEPTQFDSILKNRNALKVQIIYTQIDRKRNNKPVFTNYYFNLDHNRYYYPASTVKLPTALLALQEMNKLKREGVNRQASMITEASYKNETPVYNDPTAEDGRPTVEHYIQKIFLVSDNDAFNRLYEWLGQEYINKQLHHKGYKSADIVHRLSVFLSEDENRHTNPVSFYDDHARQVYSKGLKFSNISYPKRFDSIGKGYYSGGKLIQHPMDFSKKNRLPLDDLHSILRSVIFPRSVPARKRFKLTDEEYQFARKYLSAYPAESRIASYDTANYWDAYGKLLYWGSQKGSLPLNMRSFSKEGDAYGFLIDAAYIVDLDKKIEFMLSAVIYCNADEILNDDKYDYDEVGFPFMKNLGRLIYQYESTRPRTYLPDLSTFRFDYGN